jgi:hypothetical protein
VKQASVLEKAATHREFAIPVTLRLLDEIHERIPAHIRRVNHGFFVIASPTPLKPEQTLEITFDERVIEAQVVYSHPQPGDGYHLGVRMTYDGDRPLRTEPRIPMDMPAEVTVAGVGVPLQARLVNMSASGLGLNVGQHIAAGEMVYVKLETGFAFGEIRHCSKISIGYRVGLKLDEFITREDERRAVKRRPEEHQKSSALARFFGIRNSSRV